MNRQLLFVYGTLMDGSGLREARLLKENSRSLGKAVLERARLFDLGEYPGAVRAASPSDRVFGQLVELDDASALEVLSRLDEYEEYDPKSRERSLFIRRKAKVRRDGELLDAWVYWYNKPIHAPDGTMSERRAARRPARSQSSRIKGTKRLA